MFLIEAREFLASGRKDKMPIVQANELTDFTRRLFEACGVSGVVAAKVANSLVLANLKGHDSHGVHRIVEYVDWLQKGYLQPNRDADVVRVLANEAAEFVLLKEILHVILDAQDDVRATGFTFA